MHKHRTALKKGDFINFTSFSFHTVRLSQIWDIQRYSGRTVFIEQFCARKSALAVALATVRTRTNRKLDFIVGKCGRRLRAFGLSRPVQMLIGFIVFSFPQNGASLNYIMIRA